MATRAFVFNYIYDFYKIHNRMPTKKEIAYDTGVDNGSLHRMLQALVRLKRLEPVYKNQIPYRIVRK
jgi:DNA-binding IclR family transcriptional regulator